MATPITDPKDIVAIAKLYLADCPAGLYHRHPNEPFAVYKDGVRYFDVSLPIDRAQVPRETEAVEGLVATLCLMLNNRQ